MSINPVIYNEVFHWALCKYLLTDITINSKFLSLEGTLVNTVFWLPKWVKGIRWSESQHAQVPRSRTDTPLNRQRELLMHLLPWYSAHQYQSGNVHAAGKHSFSSVHLVWEVNICSLWVLSHLFTIFKNNRPEVIHFQWRVVRHLRGVVIVCISEISDLISVSDDLKYLNFYS